MSTAQAKSAGTVVSMEGVIEIVTFANEEANWAVLKMRVDQKIYGHYPCVTREGRVALVGAIANIGIGSRVRVTGLMKSNKQWGVQIEVQSITLLEPKSLSEIKAYLANQVKDIGDDLAGRIVAKFKEHTLDIIDREPDRLREVAGIGEKRLKQIKEEWVSNRKYRELLLFATSIGISAKQFGKIYELHGDETIEKLQEDPYRLSREIKGIGFKKADEIAKHMGVPEFSELRIRAALEYQLEEQSLQGHCFLYSSELIATTTTFLESNMIDQNVVGQCLQKAVADGVLICERDNRIYLKEYAKAENNAVKLLNNLTRHQPPPQLRELNLLETALAAMPFKLHVTQQEAVTKALTNKVFVLTGGPGTGKTTCTKAIVSGFEHTNINITLLAPTGRAAKRMAEVIGRQAYTIHRILFSLELKIKTHQDADPLTGVIIVDEFSMVDIKLFAWLLRWLDPSAVLIIVGDKDQLPSVGAGAVLRDLLDTPTVAKVQLTEIFRQAQGSQIITCAHKINQGVMPMWDYLSRNSGYPVHSNLWVSMIEEANQQAQAALWCASELCKAFNWDVTKDCMVLAPMKNGEAGVITLNAQLQTLLNPSPAKVYERGGGVRWGIGDKVMQTRNNYNLDVFNGDIGIIKDLCLNGNALENIVVEFDGREVRYETSEDWNALQLAYCSTIHKVQGCEFPMVVICLHSSHYMLLQRNLIYTAVTRGAKLVVILASGSALSRAVANNVVAKRNTSLSEKLTERALME